MWLSSFIFGNCIAYFQFKDVEDVSTDLRNFFVTILLGCGLAGTVILVLLLPTKSEKSPDVPAVSPWQSLVDSFKLMADRDMQLLMMFFLFMGVELTFTTGVYGACLGFTRGFAGSTGMSALHGMGNGLGGLTSGLLLAAFGKVTNRIGRFPVVLLGFGAHIMAYVIIFLNIPNDATLGYTSQSAILVPSNKELAIFASFLLGFGDSSFNSQTLSILGLIYRDQAAPAFALFKLVQSGSAALAFFLAGHIQLYFHLGLMLLMGGIGTFAYVIVDLKTMRMIHAQPNSCE